MFAVMKSWLADRAKLYLAGQGYLLSRYVGGEGTERRTAWLASYDASKRIGHYSSIPEKPVS